MKLISILILASLCMSSPQSVVSVHDDTTQSTQIDTICYKDTTLQPTIYKGVYIREEANHECPW